MCLCMGVFELWLCIDSQNLGLNLIQNYFMHYVYLLKMPIPSHYIDKLLLYYWTSSFCEYSWFWQMLGSHLVAKAFKCDGWMCKFHTYNI